MGKSSRKMQRKVKKEKGIQNAEDIVQEVAEIRRLKAEGEFDAALTAVIASFEKHGTYADTTYEAAEIYYLSGDYERAATWCNKTMDLQRGHAGVVLLLAKIALMQDKTEDTLALMNKLAQQCLYKDELQDLLQMLLIDVDEEYIVKNYPTLWEFIKEADASERGTVNRMEVTGEKPAFNDVALVKEADYTLELNQRCKVDESAVQIKEDLPVNSQPVGEEQLLEIEQDFTQACDEQNSLRSVVEALQAKVQAAKEEKNPLPEVIKTSPEKSLTEQERDKERENGLEASFTEVQKEIMEKPISLREKVALCQRKAAGFYAEKNYEIAVAILELALSIDRADDLTLKNLGYVLYEMGDRAKAVSYFMEVKQTDFMILNMIK